MLKASDDYKAMMKKPIRNRGYISISLGLVNQSAQGDAELKAEELYLSNGNVFDTSEERITYATCENNFVKANGKFVIPPRKNSVALIKDNGFISKSMLQPIRIDLGQMYDIKGFTIQFEPTSYPTSFKIEVAKGVHNYSMNNDDNGLFETEDTLGETNYVVITPIAMVGGQQRMHIKSIMLGVGVVFTNADTENAELISFISSVSTEVSYCDYKISAFDKLGRFDVDNDDSFMSYLEPMQPISISIGVDLDDGTQEWMRVASGYLEQWNTQSGKITFTGTDRLSQLQDTYSHMVIQRRTAYSEFVRIFQSAGLEPDEYDIDDYLFSVYITNPIEESSHKECLQILANACRCIIFEDEKSIIHVRANFETVLDPEDLIVRTNGHTAYSHPENVLKVVGTHYADLSNGTFPMDATPQFLPESVSQYANDTGYVSNLFSTYTTQKPYIEFVLPAKYTYYGINVVFGGTVPRKVRITTYDGDTVLNTFDYSELDREMSLYEEFANFNKMRLECLETDENARFIVDKLSFGNATDYVLSKDVMMDNPHGFKEEKVKSVKVRIFTYELDDEGQPRMVDDEVYHTYTVGTTGVVKVCENPLINTVEQANIVAKWLANYFINNVSYQVDFRGEPRLQAGDIIHMDSDFKNNLQVEVEKNTLIFNGAFSGNLELRRALRNLKEQGE